MEHFPVDFQLLILLILYGSACSSSPCPFIRELFHFGCVETECLPCRDDRVCLWVGRQVSTVCLLVISPNQGQLGWLFQNLFALSGDAPSADSLSFVWQVCNVFLSLFGLFRVSGPGTGALDLIFYLFVVSFYVGKSQEGFSAGQVSLGQDWFLHPDIV